MSELPEGMFRQVAPCIDCPFRRDGKHHSPEMMASYIGYFLGTPCSTFPCHRSVPKDDPRTQWSAWREGQTLCAGGLIFAKKQGVENFLMRYGRVTGQFDAMKLTDEGQIFDSIEEMLEASEEGEKP